MIAIREYNINITAENIPEVEALLLNRTNLVFRGLYVRVDDYIEFIHGSQSGLAGYSQEYKLFVSLDDDGPFDLFHKMYLPGRTITRQLIIDGRDFSAVIDAIVTDHPIAARLIQEHINLRHV